MKVQISLAIFLIFLFCNACKKDKLPLNTHVGENTMGCRVNREVWLPKGEWGLVNASVDYEQGRLSIYASNTRDIDRTDITIDIENLTGAGKILCGDSNLYRLEYDRNETLCTGCSLASGWVDITYLDTVDQIVSGTFEFWAQCDSTEVVIISEGRFDFNYPYYR